MCQLLTISYDKYKIVFKINTKSNNKDQIKQVSTIRHNKRIMFKFWVTYPSKKYKLTDLIYEMYFSVPTGGSRTFLRERGAHDQTYSIINNKYSINNIIYNNGWWIIKIKNYWSIMKNKNIIIYYTKLDKIINKYRSKIFNINNLKN